MVFDPNLWSGAVAETRTWMGGELRLQRPDGSVLHQLLEAWRKREIIEGSPRFGFTSDPVTHFASLLDANFHVFVVEHDWASAFANSNIKLFSKDEMEFIQPYEHCCFEFLISGKRTCYIVHSDGDKSVTRVAVFIKLKLGWFQIFWNHPDSDILTALVGSQHQAILIALDSAVAEIAVIRAPHKLNRAREKCGKIPVLDHNVVNLSRRSQPAALPPDHDPETSRGVRLHFRRGHWRHFETFKTWINWTLVGDPDLGFVDKHYRL